MQGIVSQTLEGRKAFEVRPVDNQLVSPYLSSFIGFGYSLFEIDVQNTIVLSII